VAEDGDPVAETRQTYDVIARRYLEHKRRRPHAGYLPDLLERFCRGLPEGGRVADLGCGPGIEVRALLERGLRPLGVDLSAGMLACAAEVVPGRLVQADVRRLPLASASLDGVWSVHALLHVPAAELPAVLTDVRRVLRPGGQAALSLAAGEEVRREEVAYWPGRYRTFVNWRLPDLVTAVGQAGLQVDDSGHSAEVGRDVVWVLASRPVSGSRPRGRRPIA
jgi:SAM-dependent methyltransferase